MHCSVGAPVLSPKASPQALAASFTDLQVHLKAPPELSLGLSVVHPLSPSTHVLSPSPAEVVEVLCTHHISSSSPSSALHTTSTSTISSTSSSDTTLTSPPGVSLRSSDVPSSTATTDVTSSPTRPISLHDECQAPPSSSHPYTPLPEPTPLLPTTLPEHDFCRQSPSLIPPSSQDQLCQDKQQPLSSSSSSANQDHLPPSSSTPPSSSRKPRDPRRDPPLSSSSSSSSS
eukprot:CAMPEP_0184661678 /NCGR_PEP_ID=MMETSP0308-20130426/39575_1 /TAXON_ID=38269 /ORGANISM="Gloeochaete witrockiana, Strain SAG 46.84" /LENGTH=229 /DNA_ID=CAMNT_0027103149 /DNA_START=67 /DNA_END=752 /DNA_ORIENTATION=-